MGLEIFNPGSDFTLTLSVYFFEMLQINFLDDGANILLALLDCDSTPEQLFGPFPTTFQRIFEFHGVNQNKFQKMHL